jgi:hypothetical protein
MVFHLLAADVGLEVDQDQADAALWRPPARDAELGRDFLPVAQETQVPNILNRTLRKRHAHRDRLAKAVQSQPLGDG